MELWCPGRASNWSGDDRISYVTNDVVNNGTETCQSGVFTQVWLFSRVGTVANMNLTFWRFSHALHLVVAGHVPDLNRFELRMGGMEAKISIPSRP